MLYTFDGMNTCFARLLLYLRRTRYFLGMIWKTLKRGTYWGRMYCVDDGKKLIYMAVCKVASTSFRSLFLDIKRLDDDKSFKERVRAAKNYKANLNLNEYKDYYKFSFVRNPFSRLVSCYEQKYHWVQDRPFFQFYLMGYLAKDRGFAEFARRATRIPRFLADRHFCCQYALLYDKQGNPLCDYVGRFENLQADYQPLRERFGLAELPHFRTSASSSNNWRDYYDEPLAKLVYDYYRDDVIHFGYEEDYRRLLEYVRENAKNRDS